MFDRVCSLGGCRVRFTALGHPWDVAQSFMTVTKMWFKKLAVRIFPCEWIAEGTEATVIYTLRYSGLKIGESCARLNGLRYANPGMKTLSVRTEKRLMCGWVNWSRYTWWKWGFQSTVGSIWPITAQLLAKKQVGAGRVSWQHNIPLSSYVREEGKSLSFRALYQVSLALPHN